MFGGRPLYVVTLLTGSFLLFLMQPLVARIALPRLGGTPAVWNSAMLVYQALLLGGYAYAHVLGRLAPRVQAGVHLVAFLGAAAWLPPGLAPRAMPAGASPILWVPWLFATSVGPLFLVVAAQAPLMQRWFGLVAPDADPFPLYAASNLGSFAGLIAYPLVVEPLLDLHVQRGLWSAGYGALALLVAACAWRLPRGGVAREGVRGAPPGWRIWATWLALAAVPSGLILATTTHLTTDLVAMPLLWVVPLGLYLLGYALAFAESRVADRIAAGFPVALVLAAATAFASGTGATPLAVAAALLFLFVASTALHRRLYLARPDKAWLTGYYLALSIGGVIGGLFGAVIAPAMFDWGYEGPLLILAAAALAGGRAWFPALLTTRRARGGLAAAAVLLALAAGAWVPPESRTGAVAAVWLGVALLVAGGRAGLTALLAACLMLAAGGWRTIALSARGDVRVRSYFGIYTVADRGTNRELISGTTLHGVQRRVAGEATWPTSYYARGSGVGDALALAPALYGREARIGVVGLGAGTLACHARPGQRWTFYEIDPAIVAIARDPARFDFLARCAPAAGIVMGDARLSLAAAAPRSLDVLAVDAFSSDAVPMHLLTREAFGVYARALAPDGLLLVHVSNRFLDLTPVVAASAPDGWRGWVRDYRPDADAIDRGAGRSVWIALSPAAAPLDRLSADDGRAVGGWARLARRPGFRAWTDDHASLLAVLR